jgi:thioredoxin family protein
MASSVVTPQRFAKGWTFEDYVRYVGTPENLAREAWGGYFPDSGSKPTARKDNSAVFRERYERARLSEHQAAAIKWLAAQPDGPARILVISEDWSSDCRRDVPYLARVAEAGGLDLRIFARDGDVMLMKGLPDAAAGGNADLVNAYANEKNGQRFASVPVAVFFAPDFTELYRYVEYPATYKKERLIGHLRAPRPGESEEQTRARAGSDISALLESPFFDVWAHAGIAEILSALHERASTRAAS